MSVALEKHWTLRPYDWHRADAIATAIESSNLLGHLLAARGIDSASDVDIFRIKSQSSTTRDLFVSIEAVDTGLGTLADPQVRVLKTIGNNFVVTDNADGSGLAADNDGGVGRDAFVGFDTSTNGDRFIEVSSADGSIGSYVLRVGQNVEPLDGPLPTPDDFIF